MINLSITAFTGVGMVIYGASNSELVISCVGLSMIWSAVNISNLLNKINQK